MNTWISGPPVPPSPWLNFSLLASQLVRGEYKNWTEGMSSWWNNCIYLTLDLWVSEARIKPGYSNWEVREVFHKVCGRRIVPRNLVQRKIQQRYFDDNSMVLCEIFFVGTLAAFTFLQIYLYKKFCVGSGRTLGNSETTYRVPGGYYLVKFYPEQKMY